MGVWTGWRGVLRTNEDPQHLGFYCPACDELHLMDLQRWQWNGSYEQPTFQPSLVNMTGHHVGGQPQPPNCEYCKRAAEKGRESFCCRCHLNITAGVIFYHPDCSHSFRGNHPMGVHLRAS